MARHSQLGQEHFDLLPFINILMCTLGCLLLIALSMASLSLGSAGEEWLPNRANTGPKPVLLIWDGNAITAQIGRDLFCVPWPPGSAATVPDCPPEARPQAFAGLMDYLRTHRGTYYALIALRPSGFLTFDSLKAALTKENISVGYEPIAQSKQVRLSAEDATQ